MTDLMNINKEGSVLRKHQMAMLEMLVFIDKICMQYHIPYYLSGGTLLGAVRHQGFIPWDDDLDIIFLKKDFSKLIDILSNLKSDKYELQCQETDCCYVAPYAKLRMKNTEIKECNDNDLYYKYKGIYIDLFYLEPAVPFFHFIANHLQNVLLKVSGLNPKRRIKPSIIRFTHRFLYRICFPVFSQLSFLLSRKKISYPLGSYFNTQFDKSWYNSSVKQSFEKTEFCIPQNYKSILKAQYGNYLLLPDWDKIENHVRSITF